MIRPQPKPKPDPTRRRRRPHYSRKLAHPKTIREANAAYRRFVVSRGCQVRKTDRKHHCERSGGSEYSPRAVIVFAHIPAQKSASIKGSDVGGGIGLCWELHREQEDSLGWRSFGRKYLLDYRAIAKELAEEWERRNDGKDTRAPNRR